MDVNDDLDPLETSEWLDALRAVQQHRGTERSQATLSTHWWTRRGATGRTCHIH